jgi:hypothetical protein
MKTVAFIFAFIILPSVVWAAPRTYAELAGFLIQLINAGIGVALTLAVVVYFYGIVSNMSEANEGKFEKMRTHITWGIIALFVMFSVWGILGLIRNTLFGGGAGGFDSAPTEVFCDTPDCAFGE